MDCFVMDCFAAGPARSDGVAGFIATWPCEAAFGPKQSIGTVNKVQSGNPLNGT